MAKERKEKKEKKEKAAKLEDPVSDGATRVSKKDKKERKDKKTKVVSADAATALLEALDQKKEVVVEVRDADGDVVPAAELVVPFAQPLANEKATKKVLKCVKKGAKNKCLKRGVKEVVKALRKSPVTTAGSSTPSNGLVILAADISPMDVISHIPVLCEDHGIPYIFVASRAELGAAGATKRPTSVVMVMPGAGAAKKGKDPVPEEGFKEAYDDAVKLVETAQRAVVF